MINIISLTVKETLSTHNQATGITLGVLSNARHCDIRVEVLVDKLKLNMGWVLTMQPCTVFKI